MYFHTRTILTFCSKTVTALQILQRHVSPFPEVRTSFAGISFAAYLLQHSATRFLRFVARVGTRPPRLLVPLTTSLHVQWDRSVQAVTSVKYVYYSSIFPPARYPGRAVCLLSGFLYTGCLGCSNGMRQYTLVWRRVLPSGEHLAPAACLSGPSLFIRQLSL